MKKSNLSKYWDLISLFKQLSLVLLLVFAIGCTEGSTDDPKDPTPENPPVNDDDDKDDEEPVTMEDMLQYIEDSQSVIDPWFEECNDIDELAKHVDEIEALDYISEVSVEDETLFVTLNGGLTIGWSYKEYPSYSGDDEQNSLYTPTVDYLQEAKIQATESNGADHNPINNTRIGIIELTLDPIKINQASKLSSSVEDANLNASYADYFSTSDDVFKVLADCNLIWFMTHGEYYNSTHFFLFEYIITIYDDFCLFDVYDDGNVIYVKRKVLGHDIYVEKWLSETYLKKHIKLCNDAIIFCGACDSLKGSTSVANIFRDKGAIAYFGYNDSNSVGAHAGRAFIENMLKGMTVEQAYDNLSNRWKKEDSAALKANYWNGGEDYCIVHPEVKTILVENQDITEDKVVLNGIIEEVNKNQLLEMTPGFCWSTTNSKPTIDSCDDYKNLKKVSGIKKDEYDFECEIDDIEPNTTYYYRAYIHFNDEVWYGDVKTFEMDYDPEAYMRAYLIKLYNDTDGDNWTVNKNWCSNEPLNTWAGVSKDEDGLYSISLSIATRSNNLNGAINLSGCKCLKYLYLYHSPYASEKGKITSIDVSDCTALTDLSCQGNSITYINAHNCSNLDYLDCSYNNLIELDLGNCENLVWLNCSDNFLESLNVDQFPRLETLYCEHNHITAQISKHMHQIEWLLYDKKYKYYGYGDNWEYEENEYGWYYPGEPSERGHNAPEAWH